MGEGVVVAGANSARGIELITRSEAKGLCFASWGVGDGVDVVEGGDAGGGGGWRAFLAASSHASRADGSTGQAEGGGSLRGAWTRLEEVFPILMPCE
jgi:hypothetical protein